MAITVAMYEKAYERIGARLDALDLDISVQPFRKDGTVLVNDASVPANEASVDFLWFSPDINADQALPQAFDTALHMKHVGVLQTFNAGLDNSFYKKISDKGVRISNSSAQAIAISEFVFAHVLNAYQPLAERRRLQKSAEWKITPFRELAGTRWLIVGYGPIGSQIAKRAAAFDAKVTVIRRSPQTSDIVDRAGTLTDLPELSADADIVILACALNAETRGFADAGFFANLKPGALFVNIARGGLVDDTALISALDNDRLEGAILDVFHQEPLPADDPLWSHPKVTLTAHTSFAGSGVRDRWDALFFENIVRFVNGDSLVNEVNPADIP